MKPKWNFFTFGLDETLWGAWRDLPRKFLGSDFLRQVAGTFATRVALLAVGVVTSVLVARILGPSGRGLFAVAVTVGAVGAQFGNLGLHSSNTYYVSRDRKALPRLLGNSLMVSFALGGGGALAAWVLFQILPGWAPLPGWVLAMALAWIPFSLAFLLLQNLLLGIQDVKAFNRVELVSKVASVALIGLVIFLGKVRVESLLAASFLPQIGGLAWMAVRLKGSLRARPSLSLEMFKSHIAYGLKAYLVALFAFLVIRIDLLMVQYLKGPEQAGYYSVAANLADLVFMLPVVVGTLLFPRLSSMSSRRGKWLFTRKVTAAVAGVLFLGVGAAALLAPALIHLLYGADFMPAVPAFLWLLPGIYFLGVQVVAAQFLNSVGFPSSVVWAWGATALLNLALNFWAIPLWGMAGASRVSSLSYFLICAFIFGIIRKTVGEGKTK